MKHREKHPFHSHLNEHVSNFAAVSTQVNVTLWKDDRLMKLKDGKYLVKLLRPEDRSVGSIISLSLLFKLKIIIFRMAELMPTLHELVQLHNDKISKFGDVILFSCVRYVLGSISLINSNSFQSTGRSTRRNSVKTIEKNEWRYGWEYWRRFVNCFTKLSTHFRT